MLANEAFSMLHFISERETLRSVVSFRVVNVFLVVFPQERFLGSSFPQERFLAVFPQERFLWEN
jgi:hypothetical protein